jgi:formate hydrogenlyase subunit 4
LQLYYDLAKLLRKGAVYSRSTGWIFRAAPSVVVACAAAGTLFLPMGGWAGMAAFPGDLILLAYLLGLARLAMILAALDTASAFEGMGASREAQFSALAEPAFFLGALVLVMLTGHTGISGIFGEWNGRVWLTRPDLPALVAACWFVILLTENARIPVDDPNTHLELTMIHEVMILDHSGPDLAFMLYGAALKYWIYSALMTNLLLPLGALDGAARAAAFAGGMIGVAMATGLVESVMARLRLRQIPKLLIGSGALAATALILQAVA